MTKFIGRKKELESFRGLLRKKARVSWRFAGNGVSEEVIESGYFARIIDFTDLQYQYCKSKVFTANFKFKTPRFNPLCILCGLCGSLFFFYYHRAHREYREEKSRERAKEPLTVLNAAMHQLFLDAAGVFKLKLTRKTFDLQY
jgi:hypothetical protein